MGNAKTWLKGFLMCVVMTVICGVIYTLVVTGISQLAFPFQANGSIVKGDDGKQYSLLLGQDFQDDTHMWGRVVSYSQTDLTDPDGNPRLWAGPSNLNPGSEDEAEAVQDRIEAIREVDPYTADQPIPVDLVTSSGSGLDPSISPAAAEFQVERLSHTTGKSEDEIRDIIKKCTTEPQLGVLGDPTVNVVKVNLMLDGILSE